MKIYEWIHEAAKELENAGVPDADYDARQLFLRCFSLDTAEYLMLKGKELSEAFSAEGERDEKLSRFLASVEKRKNRVPLQQILGECDFYGLSFYVNEHVLCPRQDTEILVEQVLLDTGSFGKSELSLLDICTGSGCIAVCLKKFGNFSRVTAVDISEDALSVARRNAKRLLGKDDEIRFIKSDLFAELGDQRSFTSMEEVSFDEEENDNAGFDIIVSNPPYIPSGEIERLEPEVKVHEPRIALDGMADGLYFYRKIIEDGKAYLRENGAIYFEIGFDQGESVSALLEQAGYEDIKVCKDLAGQDRVVKGRWKRR